MMMMMIMSAAFQIIYRFGDVIVNGLRVGTE